VEKRKLGTSDLSVSQLGLGCMSFGLDEKHATAIIDQAIDHGINFLDTADLYDFGLNEEFVGKAIKGKRSKIILATKVGNHWENGQSGWHWDPSKNYIKTAVKDSLRRLQTDYIDLYQLHGGTIEDPIDETIEAFEELKKEGVIRYYGISSIRPNVIRKYVEKSSIVSGMMQYSILDRRPEEEMLSLLNDHEISVIARGPLARGLLTNRPIEMISQTIRDKGYLDHTFIELTRLLAKLKEIFPERKLTDIALQYVLHNQAIAVAVTGASKLEQLIENHHAIQANPLTDEEYKIIQNIVKAAQYQSHR